ncbi:hypothetical protein EDB84DRAFT_1513516 [Lactarius hengduanensis]|nr:hypothetical protein EDB84DRAFT_1513516 [Lactarius hengduanensis]
MMLHIFRPSSTRSGRVPPVATALETQAGRKPLIPDREALRLPPSFLASSHANRQLRHFLATTYYYVQGLVKPCAGPLPSRRHTNLLQDLLDFSPCFSHPTLPSASAASLQYHVRGDDGNHPHDLSPLTAFQIMSRTITPLASSTPPSTSHTCVYVQARISTPPSSVILGKRVRDTLTQSRLGGACR